MRLLPLLLLVFPLLEIYLLVKVGGVIGFFPTVLLLVFSAVLGLQLMRSQGFSTMGRVREGLARGEMPGLIILEGVMVWLAGLLFFLPGVVSDGVAMFLLLPALRRVMLRWFVRHPPVRPQGPGAQAGEGRVIEGEYRREDDR